MAVVGCQKICAGPVASIEQPGRMEWFSRIDTAKRIAGLHMLIERKEKRPVKALEKRRVVKRSGRAPRKSRDDSVEKARNDVDNQPNDDRPEQIREHGMNQRDSSDSFRGQVRVGDLKRHANRQGQVSKI